MEHLHQGLVRESGAQRHASHRRHLGRHVSEVRSFAVRFLFLVIFVLTGIVVSELLTIYYGEIGRAHV